MTTALAVIAEQVAPLPALPAADIDRAVPLPLHLQLRKWLGVGRYRRLDPN
jgi:hypothetical protein